jgi:hypothetical protein
VAVTDGPHVCCGSSTGKSDSLLVPWPMRVEGAKKDLSKNSGCR